MFWKKQESKAIKFRYIVDGVEKNSKLQIDNEKILRNVLKDIIKNRKQYLANACIDAGTQLTPSMEVKNFQSPHIIEEMELSVIAEVVFTFEEEEEITDFSTGFGSKLIGLIALLTVIGTVFFFISYRDTRKRVEAYEKEGTKCFVQFIGNQPYSIVVGANEYMLEPSGKMSLHTRTFLNPWDQQVINSGKCKRVSLVAPEDKK